jgi:membrane protease YdiL (CAAX protease family)
MTAMAKQAFSSLFVSEGRLRAGWRIALYLVTYVTALLIVQTPLSVAYLFYLASTGVRSLGELQAALQTDQLPLWLYLLLKSAEVAVLAPLTFALRRWVDKRSFHSLGFGTDRGTSRELLLGLTIGAAQITLVFAIAWAAGWLSVEMPAAAGRVRGLAQGATALLLFVLVALGEELVFRGYLQVNGREAVGAPLSLLLISFGFGLFHVLNPNFRWLALLNITLAGLALGYGRHVTGSLWLPMAYHFSWNLFQGPVFGLPVSGVRYGGLLSVTDLRAPLLTGGAFGPEGGLLATVVLLLAFPVYWLWGKWRRREVPVREGPTA